MVARARHVEREPDKQEKRADELLELLNRRRTVATQRV